MASIYDRFKLSPRWSSADYTAMLERLLPEGLIWRLRNYVIGELTQDVVIGLEWQDQYDSPEDIQDTIESEGIAGDLLKRLLSCFAEELVRLEAAAWQLLNETDPGVATYSLSDWERMLGLPDECLSTLALTVDERQIAAHCKLFYSGQIQTAAFYVLMAADFGFVITIDEIPITSATRVFGASRFGPECQRFGGDGGYSILRITVTDGDGDWNILKCIFGTIKPAHVVIEWIDAR
jgi:hypothetical protein